MKARIAASILTAILFTGIAAQAKDTAASLSTAAKMHYDTLNMIMGELNITRDANEKTKLWRDILTRSEPLVADAPDFLPVWQMRGQAAMELGLWKEGQEAGLRMLALGALDKNDPKLSALMARLNRKGWLEKNTARIRLAELQKTPALSADAALPDALNTQILKIIQNLTGDDSWEGFSNLKTLYVSVGRDKLIASALARRCIATALGQACARDDLEIAELAIVCGGDVNAPVDGQPPVFWAASNGNADVVELLIGAGAEITGRSKLGRSILAEPAANGNAKVLKILLEAGVDPDTTGKRKLPLIFETVEDGHREAVAVLVDAGCNVRVKSGGDAPKPVLLPAIQRNDVEMVKVLLEGGADRDAEYKGEDMYWHAKDLGHKQVYTVLKKWPKI